MPLPAAILLRPVRDDDRDFLFRLYASTREQELAPVPWSTERKESFLRQQFDVQTSWWLKQYSDATFDVVEVDGEPGGRLYVHRSPNEHRVVDIALMPFHRARGIGTQLLSEVVAEADRARTRVSLHVEVFNPARRLYERLGFVPVEDKGVYLLMERAPSCLPS
jgi:RimJ/RimL family protein N-acetyltransferase